jgi:hypothetical protein
LPAESVTEVPLSEVAGAVSVAPAYWTRAGVPLVVDCTVRLKGVVWVTTVPVPVMVIG